jgi:chromosome segregation ATPase
MDKKTTARDSITVFLIVLSLFGIWQLIVVNNELKSSQNELQNIQAKINQEKTQYKLQIDGLNANIESANNQLEGTNQQLETTVKQLESANKELSLAKEQLEKLTILQIENANLLQTKQALEQKITNLENERQATEAKLHSLIELRKFVRQVKTEIHEQNVQVNLAKKKQRREIDTQETAAGNRGFIIKNSKSTYKNTVRIEVKPGN